MYTICIVVFAVVLLKRNWNSMKLIWYCVLFKISHGHDLFCSFLATCFVRSADENTFSRWDLTEIHPQGSVTPQHPRHLSWKRWPHHHSGRSTFAFVLTDYFHWIHTFTHTNSKLNSTQRNVSNISGSRCTPVARSIPFTYNQRTWKSLTRELQSGDIW